MSNKNSALFTAQAGGKAVLETPDGVTMALDGGEVRNSLTNANWACGGPDGHGYGAFPPDENDGPTSFLSYGGKNKFRVG